MTVRSCRYAWKAPKLSDSVSINSSCVLRRLKSCFMRTSIIVDAMHHIENETSAAANPEAEWFGAKRVKPEEKTRLVQSVFASVAWRYDLMNDVMSAGLHRYFKDRLVALMNPQPGQSILDVAGGTGDVARRCARHTQGKAKVVVCDLNPAMLEAGRAKMAGEQSVCGIEWITGNAEELPLPDGSVDAYSIAYGLRNVTHIDQALREAARVLRPGGRFFCLEFTSGVRRGLKPLFDAYCRLVMPPLGQWITKDGGAYRYLAESIQRFPDQAALARRIDAAGLGDTRWINLLGGIAVIHSARRN
jgi:demethylmenaquinone methyltransferase/2-methoxy-6-polyprenyl-1,4-benzoquinol methylase